MQFDLLRQLMRSRGEVFSRDQRIGAARTDNIHVHTRIVNVMSAGSERAPSRSCPR
ncbi:winged helix-turn-helix domain-containing protein [Ensifer sp. IC4062]|nr:winged helix-turn-helix domain-containing protein [Ensifer sp. IC4062]